MRLLFPTFCALADNFSPFRCCLVPLGIASIALAGSYAVGSRLCGFESKHVIFDLVVVVGGIVIHINLHEAYKLFRIRRRRIG